jgi:hypothetical protein
MGQQCRHFYERLLAAEMLAIVFKLFRLADITHNKHRSGAGHGMLGVAGRISRDWKIGGHEHRSAMAMPARHKLP